MCRFFPPRERRMGPIVFYPYQEDPQIRKMRVQAWFKAVTMKSGLSARELEEKFREDGGRKVKRSCIWNKYRRGEVVPRAGFRDDGRPNLLDRVETEYPGTAQWLLSPVWRLADKAPMEMSEIRAVYLGLPPLIRSLYIAPEVKANDRFWRRATKAENVFPTLSRIRDLDAFTAALAMVRESEIIQSPKAYQTAIEATVELMEMFESRTSDPLASGGLFSYLFCRYQPCPTSKKRTM